MKLKGHAKLTLRDEKTGRVVFRQEHDNDITPALSRIFGGNLVGTLNYNELMPVISRLLGGVCLFNGSVSASDVFLPMAEDATLTAHAGRNGYNDPTDDPKRGTPGQSGAIVNGWRWAWTWAGTQGNGPISDICLTHADTGDFWNEDTPNTMADDFEPVADISNKIINPSDYGYIESGVEFPHIDWGEEVPVGFYGDVDHVVTVEGAENNIIVHIGKFTGSGAWIWNALGDIKIERSLTFEAVPWEQGTFENYGIGCFYIAYDGVNRKLYAIACGQTEGTIYRPYGNTLNINCLDLETGTATISAVSISETLSAYNNYKRTDGETMPSGARFWAEAVNEERAFKQLQIVDGSVFIPVLWTGAGLVGSTDCTIRVNLNTTSDQEIVKGFCNYYNGNYRTDNVQIDLGNGRVMNGRSMAWADSNGDYKGQDIAENSDLFISTLRTVREYAASQPTDSPVQFFTYCNKDSDGVRGCILNKLYQATAFHVENGPVVKNASMTMTLEYELTQTEGGES